MLGWRSALGLTALATAIAVWTSRDRLRLRGAWLTGPGVIRVPAHVSWQRGPLTAVEPMQRAGGRILPLAAVWHATETAWGSAMRLARARQVPFSARGSTRPVAWHLTVTYDGLIIQMLPLDRRGIHAAGAIAGESANSVAIGIELEGPSDGPAPAAQVAAARRVLGVLRRDLRIARQYAALPHSEVTPGNSDPGARWVSRLRQLRAIVYG